MMWTSPLPNVARSASEGRRTPFGCEWTEPTAEKSLGIMLVFTVALTGLDSVPGMMSTSVTTVPSRSSPRSRARSPRSSPMYSFGWVSREASRTNVSASSAMPMTSPDRNSRITVHSAAPATKDSGTGASTTRGARGTRARGIEIQDLTPATADSQA